MKASAARAAIQKYGMCLVFPINNAKEPPSLWYHFFPKNKMRWEWDDSGDSRVADLWRLREELASSRKVVYCKWYRGRATFFSPDAFPAFVSGIHRTPPLLGDLSPEALEIRAILEDNSPLSTKQLKRASELVGRPLEGIYSKALRQLWNALLIVGVGEVDDGAFPSLSMGATSLMFEDLWIEAMQGSPAKHEALRERVFKSMNLRTYYESLKKRLS